MDYAEKIKRAGWLNESQRNRLLAIHATVKLKDIIEQSFDMLRLMDPSGESNPLNYRNMVVTILSKMHLLNLVNSERDDYGDLLYNLYVFFETLGHGSFDTLCEINAAYNYSGEHNSHEEAIDKLYREHLNETKEKLHLLETI